MRDARGNTRFALESQTYREVDVMEQASTEGAQCALDPNETLKELRQVTRKYIHIRAYNTFSGLTQMSDDMAGLIQALDEWLSGGGFPPEAWSHNHWER